MGLYFLKACQVSIYTRATSISLACWGTEIAPAFFSTPFFRPQRSTHRTSYHETSFYAFGLRRMRKHAAAPALVAAPRIEEGPRTLLIHTSPAIALLSRSFNTQHEAIASPVSRLCQLYLYLRSFSLPNTRIADSPISRP